MLDLFNRLFGTLYGLIRGLLASAAFLVLGALNPLFTLSFYLSELYYELVGCVETLFTVLEHCLWDTLFDMQFLTLAYNTLILALVFLPVIFLQTSFNLVVSSLSLVFDLSLNLAVNLFGALLSPFASLFQGGKTGLIGESPAPELDPPSNIFKALGAMTLNHNLPLNELFNLNEIAGCREPLHAQNTLFSNVRIESRDDNCSLIAKYATLLVS